MAETVRVRLALAINERGYWAVSDNPDEALSWVDQADNIAVHFVEADIPLPLPMQPTIQGVVVNPEVTKAVLAEREACARIAASVLDARDPTRPNLAAELIRKRK